MPTTFNSLELFSSGPHRFLIGPAGSQLLERSLLDHSYSGREAVGPLDQDITIRGRLVADSDADLWSLIAAITAQLTTPPTTATLTDPHAHDFTDMAVISFSPLAPFERGARTSVPYQARFSRLKT